MKIYRVFLKSKYRVSVELTLSCLKKHNILSSRKTRLEETKDWNTLGSFLRATRRPSLGSVTALQSEERESEVRGLKNVN